MRSPICTLNCIVAVMLVGIRQNFFESKLVTPLPVYESTLKIPFKVFCKFVNFFSILRIFTAVDH